MNRVIQFSSVCAETADEPIPHESSGVEMIGTAYCFGSFRLCTDGALLRGSEAIHLPPKELAALRLLLAHAGQLVTPDQLMQELWGEVHVTAESAPRCISSLRARLGDDDCIQTVYKKGYRLTAEVTTEAPAAKAGPPRLAILPFAIGPFTPELLGTAVSEETIVEMISASEGRATLLARDAVFLLAQRGLSSIEIGRTLEADLVLAGSIVARMTHYRLRAEMIRVADGAQIWVEDLLIPKNQDDLMAPALVNRLLFRMDAKRHAVQAQARPISIAFHQRTPQDSRQLSCRQWRTPVQDQIQDGLQQLDRVAATTYGVDRTVSK